jgi:hypothetical protein
MEEMRNTHNVLAGKPEKKNHLEDLVLDGMVMLERVLGK